MQERLKKQSKGIIGITSSFLGRYREFDVCLKDTIAPPGTYIEWALGLNVAKNFNDLARKMLSGNYQWLFILGDDHVYKPTLLLDLLERDVDMVTPFCLRRAEPFDTVVHTSHDTGYRRVAKSTFDGMSGLYDMTELTVGNAGSLIRRKVFEAIPAPWFENGKSNPEVGGSDLYFCEKVRRAGFKMYLDLDHTIGHITHAALWPVKDEEGKWTHNIACPREGGSITPPGSAKQQWTDTFNYYRAGYDKIPYEKQVEIYDVIAQNFPDQNRFNAERVAKVLKENAASQVLEIGGWKGDLAKTVLPEILTCCEWLNIEISKRAVEETVCKDSRYHAIVPDTFVWDLPNVTKGFDTLILSHVVEHWNLDQFKKLISNLNGIRTVFIDAPIPKTKDTVSWTDYPGTHVLVAGWKELDEVMIQNGFSTIDSGTDRVYTK